MSNSAMIDPSTEAQAEAKFAPGVLAGLEALEAQGVPLITATLRMATDDRGQPDYSLQQALRKKGITPDDPNMGYRFGDDMMVIKATPDQVRELADEPLLGQVLNVERYRDIPRVLKQIFKSHGAPKMTPQDSETLLDLWEQGASMVGVRMTISAAANPTPEEQERALKRLESDLIQAGLYPANKDRGYRSGELSVEAKGSPDVLADFISHSFVDKVTHLWPVERNIPGRSKGEVAR